MLQELRVCVCLWVVVLAAEMTAGCCMFHRGTGWGREGDEVDGAVSQGGANKISFYWPTTPEECLFVCMHDGGDKKLMHRHCWAGAWAGHCCPLQGMPNLCVSVCVCACLCVGVYVFPDRQISQHKLRTSLCWLSAATLWFANLKHTQTIGGSLTILHTAYFI